MGINTPVNGGGGTSSAQVSAAERTAGTETSLRSFSPDDVAVMAGIHGPGGTPSAAAVTSVPAGDLAATNVQDALNELDTEKQPLATVLTNTTASYTTAEETKLAGIETAATADQTDAEIRAAVEAATDSNVFTDADHTKLNGIETAADVTDTANVTAAGAVMDSEVTNLSGIKTLTVPDSTTISTFAATLLDDTTAAAARTTLDVDQAGTDNAPAASTTVAGKIEVATQAEVNTGTDATRAVTPDTLEGHLNGNATITDGKYEGTQTSLLGTITTVDIECDTGVFFEHTVSTATTFTLSGIPASPNVYVMRLRVIVSSGGSVVWTNFTNLEWAGGSAPTLTVGSEYDIIMSTDDAGANWRGIANEGYA